MRSRRCCSFPDRYSLWPARSVRPRVGNPVEPDWRDLGATLAFMIARYVASDWVAARAGERLARLIRGVEEEGWRFVAFVRLVPLFPFNLVNYAFGLTRIRLGEYVLASFVCMAPGALAYTYLGYAGRVATSGQAGAIGKALLALALLAPSLSCRDWCAG